MSNFSSGLINHIDQAITTFTISQSRLTGFNNCSSVSNGYICSKLSVDIQIQVNQFSVCVENTVRFGSSSFFATLSQPESLTCSGICKNNYFITYGLCSLQPQFSTLLQNETVICEYPFVFNAQQSTCECDFGFFLNVTYCVNVIMQFSIIQKNATGLEIALKNEIQKTEIELKTAFSGLEQLILSNITALTLNMNDNDNSINQNIISANNTIHNNINEMRTESNNKFSTLNGLIENKHILTLNQLTNVQNVIKNQLEEQNVLIVDYQLNINNNFTAQKDQITDLKNNVVSTLNLMEAHITSFQNSNSANDKITNENIKSMNETILKNLNDLKVENTNQLNNLAGFIENKHNLTVNTLKNKMDENQLNMKNNFSAISNTMATQSYVKSVYDSLLGTVSTQTYLTSVYNNIMAAVNAVAIAQSPCQSWPGSVNENGLCKCAYKGGNTYCPNLQSCCKFDEDIYSNNDYDMYKYSLQCANGVTRDGQYDRIDIIAYNIINSFCGGAKYYTNQ
ncbi:Hypothetical_protein [Hexamita inflata]|uniref:Hypothetical_protein n=1 Tax=Hexamita inflata TaxID=28002 RepID=A0AA86NCG6_9EUKA|nr:Hypothetical protein HINF_LOCUS4792 [Hexamita inflata]